MRMIKYINIVFNMLSIVQIINSKHTNNIYLPARLDFPTLSSPDVKAINSASKSSSSFIKSLPISSNVAGTSKIPYC